MPADSIHVAFVTSEMAPYVKTGGLADVSASLPKALVRLGHRVTVFLPRYAGIPFPPGEFVGSVHVPVDDNHRSAGFYRTRTEDGVDVVFVEHPPFFDRAALYGGLRGQPAALRVPVPGGDRVLPQPRRAARASSTPTTGRPASFPST